MLGALRECQTCGHLMPTPAGQAKVDRNVNLGIRFFLGQLPEFRPGPWRLRTLAGSPRTVLIVQPGAPGADRAIRGPQPLHDEPKRPGDRHARRPRSGCGHGRRCERHGCCGRPQIEAMLPTLRVNLVDGLQDLQAIKNK